MRLKANNLSNSGRIAHGFFTRQGGVSAGIYASLNCGSGSDDNPDHVKENRQFVMEELEAKTLITLSQIHSANIISVIPAQAGIHAGQHRSFNQYMDPGLRRGDICSSQADALVTNQTDIALGILTADCVPVLYADAQAGVIGAVHSGWKGTLSGVNENTIVAMEALGAARENIIAAIGPAIAQNSYEVGDEFYQRFADESALYATFFKPSDNHYPTSFMGEGQGGGKSESPPPNLPPQAGGGKTYLFDLTGLLKHLLAQSGLRNVEHLAIDTYSDEQRFFSYRRTTHMGEPDYGRQLSAIMLKGTT